MTTFRLITILISSAVLVSIILSKKLNNPIRDKDKISFKMLTVLVMIASALLAVEFTNYFMGS